MYVPLLLFAYTVVQNRNMKREQELEQIKADVIEEIQSKQEEEEEAKKKQDKEKAGNKQKENLKRELYRIKKRFESEEDSVVLNSIVTLIFAGIIYLNILIKNIQIKNILEN